MFDDSYSPVNINISTKIYAVLNVTDGVRQRLGNNNPQDRILLNLKLHAFYYLQISFCIYGILVCSLPL